MSKYAREIIEANRGALEQGLTLLAELSDDHYTNVCEPWLKSTIGQHIRHVADMYFTLMESEKSNCVDYDKRTRGSRVERSCSGGVEALRKIIVWLDSLNQNMLNNDSLTIKSEVSLRKSVSVTLGSSFLRELVFVGSHTVHHYAFISVIAKCQNLRVGEYFGVAPATVSFLRNEASCAQ